MLSGICQGMSWQHLHQPQGWKGVIPLSLSNPEIQVESTLPQTEAKDWRSLESTLTPLFADADKRDEANKAYTKLAKKGCMVHTHAIGLVGLNPLVCITKQGGKSIFVT